MPIKAYFDNKTKWISVCYPQCEYYKERYIKIPFSCFAFDYINDRKFIAEARIRRDIEMHMDITSISQETFNKLIKFILSKFDEWSENYDRDTERYRFSDSLFYQFITIE